MPLRLVQIAGAKMQWSPLLDMRMCQKASSRDQYSRFTGSQFCALPRRLNIPADNVSIAPPVLDRLADNVSEEWVHRFRQERQTDWINPAW